MKRLFALLIGASMLQSAAAATVVDDAGQTVETPAKVLRVADAWYAHHVLLMTLGAGSSIVETVNHERSRPWMFLVQPSLKQATSVDGTAFNAESLLADKVDLVFVSTGDRNATAYRQVGLPVVSVGFNTLDGLAHSMTMTAQAMASSSALKRADDYNAYLAEKRDHLAKVLVSLKEEQRPRVLHIASLNPLKVDGDGTLIDEWIKVAGGRNAATGLKGNLQVVSAEQLLQWQPDVIILAADAGDIEQSPARPLLENLNAVRDHRVLRNPAGVFPWDRYGTEMALQIDWAAQQLHPELFKGVNMADETMDFYRKFFDYPLGQEQAKRMLAGLGPVDSTADH